MAKYTISILDKLIENSNNKDLTDFQNLTDVSKTTLFGLVVGAAGFEFWNAGPMVGVTASGLLCWVPAFAKSRQNGKGQKDAS